MDSPRRRHSARVTYPTLPKVTDSPKVLAPKDDGHQATPVRALRAFPPSTPVRASPNIGRRRGYTTSLTRPFPSPSHSTKMATMFRDAQLSLQLGIVSPGTPSRRLSSNTKRSRIPLSHQRVGGLGTSGTPNAGDQDISQAHTSSNYTRHDAKDIFHAGPPGEMPFPALFPTPLPNIRSPLYPVGDELIMSEPISSGFASPQVSIECAVNSPVEEWNDLVESPINFEDAVQHESYHTSYSRSLTHPTVDQGVRFPLTGSATPAVDLWLKEVLEVSQDVTPSTRRVRQKYPNHRKTPPWQKQMHSEDLQEKDDAIPHDQQDSVGASLSIHHRPRSDSDKENQQPFGSSLARSMNIAITEEPPQVSPRASNVPKSKPSRFKTAIPIPSTAPDMAQLRDWMANLKSPSKIPYSSTPSHLLLQSPRRKRQKSSTDFGLARLPGAGGSRFAIAEDDVKVVPLSPDVEPWRKNNRPRQVRCPSYFDRDVIVSPSPTKSVAKTNADAPEDYEADVEDEDKEEEGQVEIRGGRNVLSESKYSEQLIKPKAFVEDAEDWKFFGL
ncbi:MAG: hypothetical protein M1827_007318 [Pycnora praestabilis]|nr:MAG: hypothetical protein M1827_007318 [Pycnora praestabilis]